MPIDSTFPDPERDEPSKTKDNIKHGKVFHLNPKPHNLSKKYTDEKFRDSNPKPQDVEKFRLVPTDQSNLGLWEQAWEHVKDEEDDWKLWPQFQGVKDLNTKEVVTDIRGLAQKRRDEAEKNQGHVLGTSLTYRKMCSKVAKCAKKFEIVGDVVAQAEPVYAALPWVIISNLEHVITLADTYHSRLLFASSSRYIRSNFYFTHVLNSFSVPSASRKRGIVCWREPN